MYNRKDHYYKMAKSEGRASRAGYKLEQIQSRYKIIKKGDFLLDIGCAPGGWLEVLSEMIGRNGLVIGIDILPIKIRLKSNVRYIQGDISDPAVMNRVADELAEHGGRRTVDVVVSDAAPNTSGVIFRDSYLSYELAAEAWRRTKNVLKEGGNFAAKIFQGEEVGGFKKELKADFKRVESYIPPATRQSSKELYLIAICRY